MRRTTRAPRTARAPRTPRALLPATALCLAALLCACGDGGGRGHAAVGAAGPADGRTPTRPVPPRDGITLTPLDGDGSPVTDNGPGPHASSSAASPPTASPPTASPPTASPPSTGRDTANSSDSGADGGHRGGHDTTAPPGSPTGRPSEGAPQRPPETPPDRGSGPGPTPKPSPEPSTPPHLTTGPLKRADTDVRWCENVSLALRNTGDRPVTSGTVTFGTHIIGALGIDWATRTSTHPLPTPIAGGARRTATWRVCVAAWRVPPGMHIDTEDVRLNWR
ncbi:hypothetical protein [Streptomyces sp. NPDC059788]|uniref:hypothetical protein n=1 Tax=Streptomyces sp. NPDC059788 TaxID=3346948 RepID=UPI0036566F1B